MPSFPCTLSTHTIVRDPWIRRIQYCAWHTGGGQITELNLAHLVLGKSSLLKYGNKKAITAFSAIGPPSILLTKH